jgi:ATP/maltotriose-dependent transcriptional regulator MalT
MKNLILSNRLTSKELETVLLVIQGLSMEEIAEKTNISKHGVKWRINSINIKQGLRTKDGIKGLRALLLEGLQ